MPSFRDKLEKARAKARVELKEKTYLEIQEATATTWCARALECFDSARTSRRLVGKFGWFTVACEYAHEAIEHAALFEDGGSLLGEVETACDEARKLAQESIVAMAKEKP
jgi:hypothetical protein